MAEPVRIVGHTSDRDSNEGFQAQVDQFGNLQVREGSYQGLNKSYEDTAFVTGDSPAVHNFYGDMGRYVQDGYMIVDSGEVQVDVTRDGINYGSKWTMKAGEKVSFLRMDIKKVRVTWVSDSAYRINLI